MAIRALTGHSPEYFEFTSTKGLAKALRQAAKWLDSHEGEEPHVISMTVDYNFCDTDEGYAAVYMVTDRSV